MNLDYTWNIFGHGKQLFELESDLKLGNLPHAYLFSGPSQIGKFSIAKMFAQILQCEEKLCGTCNNCIQMSKGYQLDTIILEDDLESIKIEQVREIVTRVSTTAQSKYKILLIQNVERLTLESANALLKTLEDPPPNVIFLLTTSHLEDLLQTIISRVRLYKFQTLSETEIKNLLQKTLTEGGIDLSVGMTPADIGKIAALSFGKPGKALNFMKNKELFEAAQNMYDELKVFLKKPDLVAQFQYVTDIAKEEHQIKDFLNIFLTSLREKMFDDVKDSANISEEKLTRTLELIKKTQSAHEMLKRNVNSRLILENLMLDI